MNRNTVVKLDPFANETPFAFREVGVFGRIEATTPYEVRGTVYNSYTMGVIEVSNGQCKIRPVLAYYIPEHLIVEVIGKYNPTLRIVEEVGA